MAQVCRETQHSERSITYPETCKAGEAQLCRRARWQIRWSEASLVGCSFPMNTVGHTLRADTDNMEIIRRIYRPWPLACGFVVICIGLRALRSYQEGGGMDGPRSEATAFASTSECRTAFQRRCRIYSSPAAMLPSSAPGFYLAPLLPAAKVWSRIQQLSLGMLQPSKQPKECHHVPASSTIAVPESQLTFRHAAFKCSSLHGPPICPGTPGSAGVGAESSSSA